MKLKEIFNSILRVAKLETQLREIDKSDQYATIKHKTKSIGFRSFKRHNNRKPTKGRRVQYVTVGNTSKPIYHGAL